MSIEEIVRFLEDETEIAESYVLLREIKAILDVGYDHFHPEIRIKIYRSNAVSGQPYHFDVSHHVHTPTQAGPYYPSRTFEESETSAIRQAISTTVTFLKSAIQAGHTPTDGWLIKNEDY